MRELVRLAEDAQSHAREDMAALLDAHNGILEAAAPTWCAPAPAPPISGVGSDLVSSVKAILQRSCQWTCACTSSSRRGGVDAPHAYGMCRAGQWLRLSSNMCCMREAAPAGVLTRHACTLDLLMVC